MLTKKTALILIGFQNDYFATDGILHSFIEESTAATKAVENVVDLLHILVKTPILIIATPIIFTKDYQELLDPVGILKIIKEVGAFQAETEGAKTISQLLPFQDKILEISGKRGFNAFVGTNLHDTLQQHQITDIVIAGAVTSICIDSTGRAAHELGYQVSILSDCISARSVFEQEFYISNIFPLYANAISSSQFRQCLEVDE